MEEGIRSFSQSTKPQCTDEFGGYSKNWFLTNSTKSNIDKATSSQNSTPAKMGVCFEDSQNDEFGIESISTLIGIDIEKKAREIIEKESPFGTRQIARPVKKLHLQQFKKVPNSGNNKHKFSPVQNSVEAKEQQETREKVEVKCFE